MIFSRRDGWRTLVGAAVLSGFVLSGGLASAPAWGQTFTMRVEEGQKLPVNEPAPAPAPAIDVDKLIAQLGSRSYREREAAQRELTRALIDGKLTPEQIAKIRDAMRSADAEIARRAQQIIRDYVATLQVVKDLVDRLKVEITRQTRISTNFTLLGMTGWINNRPETVKDLNKLMELVNRVISALLAGDTEGAKKYLEAIKDFIKNLPRDRFDDLNLRRNGERLTPDQVIDLIDGLIKNDIPKAENGIAGKLPPAPAPAPKPKVGVGGAGALNTGLSFRVDVSDVPAPGTAELLTLSDSEGLNTLPAAAPDGYEYASPAYALLADEGLEVAGTVTVALEYDAEPADPKAPASPAVEPGQLAVARIANGVIDILPVVAQDFENGVVYVRYEAETGGLDPFGVFALVQPAAPSTDGAR